MDPDTVKQRSVRLAKQRQHMAMSRVTETSIEVCWPSHRMYGRTFFKKQKNSGVSLVPGMLTHVHDVRIDAR